MSAVVVGSYYESIPDADTKLFSGDKIIVVDSKVLMLAFDNIDEAYYVCGILNSKDVVDVIDSYAVTTNRGVDVLRYLAIPKFNKTFKAHINISEISKSIHNQMKGDAYKDEVKKLEGELNKTVKYLFQL